MKQTDELLSTTALRTPPYVAYATFRTLLEDLKTNGVPPQIDRSVLKRFSGGVGNQLLMAMKSLGLVTDQNTPTANLNPMVKAYGGPDYAKHLALALNHGFPFLGSLDLTTATPSMFADAFKDGTSAKEDVLKKCRRFFLQAASDAGVQIGPRIANGHKGSPRASAGSPSPAAPRRRAAPVKRVERQKPLAQPHMNGNNPPADIRTQLIGKFPEFDPSWPDQIKTAWFDGFQKLMSTATKENGDPQ